jgi:hypothetical protein
MEMIKYFPDKKWNWNKISCHKNVKFDDIKNNSHLPWNIDYISKNPNITMDIIEKYINIKWSYYYISMNPNITLEFIDKYHEKLNYKCLSNNFLEKSYVKNPAK